MQRLKKMLTEFEKKKSQASRRHTTQKGGGSQAAWAWAQNGATEDPIIRYESFTL